MPARALLSGFFAFLLALLATSCSSTPDSADLVEATVEQDSAFSSSGYQIERVKISRLQERNQLRTTDQSVAFNQRRLLWGAISNAEQRERFGQYFTVDWEGPKDSSATATLRFEYRQQKTAAAVTTLEQTVPVQGGEQFSKFAITGTDFVENGVVTSWRVTILIDGQKVAAQPSFLWD